MPSFGSVAAVLGLWFVPNASGRQLTETQLPPLQAWPGPHMVELLQLDGGRHTPSARHVWPETQSALLRHCAQTSFEQNDPRTQSASAWHDDGWTQAPDWQVPPKSQSPSCRHAAQTPL